MKLLFLTPSYLIPPETQYQGLEVLRVDDTLQKTINTIHHSLYLSNDLKLLQEYLMDISNDENITPIIEGDYGFIYTMTRFCHDNYIMPLYRSNNILKNYRK
jgi:glutathione synthase/RimK-type ligase-like ATP-grasp enzyme